MEIGEDLEQAVGDGRGLLEDLGPQLERVLQQIQRLRRVHVRAVLDERHHEPIERIAASANTLRAVCASCRVSRLLISLARGVCHVERPCWVRYLHQAGERAHDGALQEVVVLGELPQLRQALEDEVSVALDLFT